MKVKKLMATAIMVVAAFACGVAYSQVKMSGADQASATSRTIEDVGTSLAEEIWGEGNAQVESLAEDLLLLQINLEGISLKRLDENLKRFADQLDPTTNIMVYITTIDKWGTYGTTSKVNNGMFSYNANFTIEEIHARTRNLMFVL